MNSNTNFSYHPITLIALVTIMLMLSLQQVGATNQSLVAFPINRPDYSFIMKVADPETAQPAMTLNAFMADLTNALTSTADQTDILPLTAENFAISEWWGDWETTSNTMLSTQLGEMHLTETLSVELIPNEALWFMGDMNPYTDLLPGADVEAVYLTHGWDGNGDSQALLFVTAADNGGYEWGGMIFTQTGFMR